LGYWWFLLIQLLNWIRIETHLWIIHHEVRNKLHPTQIGWGLKPPYVANLCCLTFNFIIEWGLKPHWWRTWIARSVLTFNLTIGWGLKHFSRLWSPEWLLASSLKIGWGLKFYRTGTSGLTAYLTFNLTIEWGLKLKTLNIGYVLGWFTFNLTVEWGLKRMDRILPDKKNSLHSI
jgi:hypothetical protein